MVLREDIGAKCRGQKYYEVGNLHTRFGTPCGPVAADCLAVDQSRERWQIWCKHSSGERARIQFRKFPGGGERGVRHPYQAAMISKIS